MVSILTSRAVFLLKTCKLLKEKKGFTLVEVMVTALLIAIVSSGIISYAIFAQNNIALIKEQTQKEFMAEEIAQLMFYESVCTDTLKGLDYPTVDADGDSTKESVTAIKESNVVSGTSRIFYETEKLYGDIDFAKVLLKKMWAETPFDTNLPTSQQCHYRYRQKKEEGVVFPFLIAPTKEEEAFEVIRGVSITAVATSSLFADRGFGHTCAVQNGDLRCWGNDNKGQLGDGTNDGVNDANQDDADASERVVLTGGVTAVAAGGGYGDPRCTCAIQNGNLRCWGNDSNGQLGDGTNDGVNDANQDDADASERVVLTGGVTAVSAGDKHTCAIQLADLNDPQSGNLRCWGNDSNGQLGDGGNNNGQNNAQHAHREVLTGGVTAVAAGEGHTCAIQLADLNDPQSGNLRCWGNDSNGQLGDGGNNNGQNNAQHAHREVLTGGVTAVAAGEGHTCAIQLADPNDPQSGNLRCWGRDGSGQLGDGANDGVNDVNQDDADASERVVLTGGVTAVSAGDKHTCAIQNDNLRCWGSSGKGQLGDNNTNVNRDDAGAPEREVLTGGVTAVSATGEIHTCAIQNNSLRCWGNAGYKALGDGNDSGIYNNAEHEDRVVLTGGGQAPVPASLRHPSIAAGGFHTCALRWHNEKRQDAYCWGYNGKVMLGQGVDDDDRKRIETPISVVGPPGDSDNPIIDFKSLSAGYHQTCGIRKRKDDDPDTTDDESVKAHGYCWGSGAYGRMGLGKSCTIDAGVTTCTNRSSNEPTILQGHVDDSDPNSALMDFEWTFISIGKKHACGIRYEGHNYGKAYCWGLSTRGLLGTGEKIGHGTGNAACPPSLYTDGCYTKLSYQLPPGEMSYPSSDEHKARPVLVVGSDGNASSAFSDWAYLSAGTLHTCGLRTTGEIYCWGFNRQGQLGSTTPTTVGNTPDPAFSPKKIDGGEVWKFVSAGFRHTCAINLDGVLHCWGGNHYGELGLGTSGSSHNSATPQKVNVDSLPNSEPEERKFQQVAAGRHATCAISEAQKLYCWGDNRFGQLGLPSATEIQTQPQRVNIEDKEIDEVSVGFYHTCASVEAEGDLSPKKIYCWGGGANALLEEAPSERGDDDDEIDRALQKNYGQVGDGYRNMRRTPVDIDHFLKDQISYTTMAMGGTDEGTDQEEQGHTCLLHSEGYVSCVGKNHYGQLGLGGNNNDDKDTPNFVKIEVGPDNNKREVNLEASQIVAGQDFTCIVTPESKVKCWGKNDSGQLGNGTTVNSHSPVGVTKSSSEPSKLLSNVQYIASGESHTCVIILGTEGSVNSAKCWGKNDQGQLGDGTTTNPSRHPVDVIKQQGSSDPLSSITQMSANIQEKAS